MSVMCNIVNSGVYGNPNLRKSFIRESFEVSTWIKTDVKRKKKQFRL